MRLLSPFARFRTFRTALQEAWDGAGRGKHGFLAMGRAYIRFALENPPHYRVMFGGYVAKGDCEAELAAEGEAAFRVLVDALGELQQADPVRQSNPLELAMFVWASVHGTAMLAIGGQLPSADSSSDGMAAMMVGHVWDALTPPSSRA